MITDHHSVWYAHNSETAENKASWFVETVLQLSRRGAFDVLAPWVVLFLMWPFVAQSLLLIFWCWKGIHATVSILVRICKAGIQ
jgi:hypothetical protein